MAAHRLILDQLQVLTPSFPTLSEESKAAPYESRQNWGTFWLIDPLDGTKEFIARNGEFTVNIALIENGVPVAGGGLAPGPGWCYVWTPGGGAAWHGAGRVLRRSPRRRRRQGSARPAGPRAEDADPAPPMRRAARRGRL